jgi:hypothetical protein
MGHDMTWLIQRTVFHALHVATIIISEVKE